MNVPRNPLDYTRMRMRSWRRHGHNTPVRSHALAVRIYRYAVAVYRIVSCMCMQPSGSTRQVAAGPCMLASLTRTVQPCPTPGPYTEQLPATLRDLWSFQNMTTKLSRWQASPATRKPFRKKKLIGARSYAPKFVRGCSKVGGRK